MKAVNFWKTLFCAALAVTAFAACSDDDDNGGNSGMPEITVNGAESVAVAATLEGGKADPVIEVVSNGKWTLSFNNPDDSQWCTPSTMSGKAGTTQLSFTLAQATAERTANITLTVSSSFEGIPLTKTASIAVKQNAGGSIVVETNVKSIREKLAALATKEGVEITEDLTLTGIVVSDVKAGGFAGNRNCALVDNTTEPGAGIIVRFANPYEFGVGKVITASIKGAKAQINFDVLQVNLEGSAVQFSEVEGTAVNVEPIPVAVADLPKYESQLVRVNDVQPVTEFRGKKFFEGTNSYTSTKMEVKTGESFDLSIYKTNDWAKETVVPDKSGYVCGLVSIFKGAGQIAPRNASDIVLDQELFEVTIAYTKGTVAEAIAAGADKAYEVSATVVAMHTQGILIGDESGVMLAFQGVAPEVAVNDQVTVKGMTELRNGVIQFGKTGLTVTKTGTGSYKTPEPEVMDGKAVTDYIATAAANKAVYKYVKYLGEFAVSGNYYNVVIAGTETQGSVAYGKTEWNAFDKQQVVVEGWLLGGTQKYLQTMATSIKADTTTPFINADASVSFKAEGETKAVAFTAGNLGSNKVFAKIDGTDKAQFSVAAGEIAGNSIDVTAVANEAAEAKSAALTLYVAAAADAAPVASVEVSLRQAGKSAGGDRFTSMDGTYPTADDSGNAVYAANIKTPDGRTVPGMKLGTGKKGGVFTTGALNLTGDKKLSFYAVAWSGKTAKIYIRVNNGGEAVSPTGDLRGDSGATGLPNPYVITWDDATDYFTIDLKGLTAASTLTISTNPTFDTAASSNGRAVLAGIQIH